LKKHPPHTHFILAPLQIFNSRIHAGGQPAHPHSATAKTATSFTANPLIQSPLRTRPRAHRKIPVSHIRTPHFPQPYSYKARMKPRTAHPPACATRTAQSELPPITRQQHTYSIQARRVLTTQNTPYNLPVAHGRHTILSAQSRTAS